MERLIRLNGSLPTDGLSFISAQIMEHLGQHSQASVIIESEEVDPSPDNFLGHTLNLSFETYEGQWRYFDGVIVGMTLFSHSGGGRSVYGFELKSWTWRLDKNRDFRVFQGLTVPDIIREVLAPWLGASFRVRDNLQGHYIPWEYCVQYAESDYRFITRLMEQEGIYFFFEHHEDGHVLVLMDLNAAHIAYPGFESVAYNPAGQGAGLTENFNISALQRTKVIEPPRFAHSDYNFKIPSTRLLNKNTGDMLDFNRQLEVFEYPGEFESQGDGSNYAQLRQEALLATQEIFRGETNARGVASGYVLTPSNESRPGLSIDLLIFSTSIHIQEPSAEAQHGGASFFSCHFQATPLTQQYRTVRTTTKPLIHGTLPAVVVGPKGQEIHTDEFGRVKVQFFWDRRGQHNERSSCWIRTAYPVAGKGWGFVAIPRIGQEVVVSFEAGDPDRPLIIAAVHNAEQAITYELPAQKTVSGWRTHSTQDGSDSQFNELRFEDKKGQEYVWFQAEKDYLSLIKHDSQERIGRDAHRVIERDHFEEIVRNDSKTVQGESRLQVQKSMHVRVDDDFLTRVQGCVHLIGNSYVAIKTQGDFSLNTLASMHVKAASDICLDAGSKGHWKTGNTLNISAGQQIVLSVGGSSITISASGILFNGPAIGMNGGGGGGAASNAAPTAPDEALMSVEPLPPVDPLA